MMGLYSPEELRHADWKAMNAFNIPGALLMENAGRNAAEAIVRRFRVPSALILAGRGNNGGDGFVVARHLALRGLSVEVLLASPGEVFRDDGALNLAILRSLQIPCLESPSLDEGYLSSKIAASPLLVDALLGTGASGAPRGEIRRLIALSEGHRQIVSLDLPSGVDGATGEVPDVAVSAALTVTFAASKPGLHILPGAARAGEVVVVDIGLEAMKILPPPHVFLARPDDLVPSLLCPRHEFHKGRRGTVVVVGGSRTYQGAPLLAALGALRAGAGIVLVAIPEDNLVAGASFLPEAVFEPLPSRGETLSAASIDRLLSLQERADALIVGPGLGRSPDTRELVGRLWQAWEKPLLVDGDGLWALAEEGDCLSRRGDALLTPHEGEAGRLLGEQASNVAASRLRSLCRLSGRWGTVLLKGWDSLIGDGEKTHIVSLGSPSLAVPGSGDVLAGMIGAFLAQGQETATAALAGTILHGQAGQAWTASKGVHGLLAREIAETAPSLLKRFSNGAAAT
ncbi:NAD(P)H-hydrate dehydratase [Aminirod propionatiphilus]|uniref:NAD(P)H-hydrate dehydratase n=1 Tax=Aminirod propionatiphilus TaxID=3415223 RepID=A0ACD1DZ19_9BACT|nr:NAD(P)H-hydrate dehydratase [Synergistota bacterium]